MSHKPLTIGQAWRNAAQQLNSAGIEGATRDAKLLAGLALGKDALALSLEEHHAIDGVSQSQLDALVARRIAREPIARILGFKEFYALDFHLNDDTLMPRPETEQVVDLALERAKSIRQPRILDLGTGSGCIAIALAVHLPGARLTAVDQSAGALEQARLNARHHHVEDRMRFLAGSWFDPLGSDDRFDIIVSNPPYIRHDDLNGLAPEVRGHDPGPALDGGVDGLDPYRLFAANAQNVLEPGGFIVMEHGVGQGDMIGEIFVSHGWRTIDQHHDLAGLDRVLTATHPG